METGIGCFELHYDFSTLKNFGMSSLIGAYFKQEALTNPMKAAQETFPVITMVKQLSDDKVEIRRTIMYKNFFNSMMQYPEERIIIDRTAAG